MEQPSKETWREMLLNLLVFLPPSYAKEKSRRYPVVYALHGYSIGAEQWSREIHVPETIEGAFAQGAVYASLRLSDDFGSDVQQSPAKPMRRFVSNKTSRTVDIAKLSFA
jgi:enterochelin esterase-like enzyme